MVSIKHTCGHIQPVFIDEIPEEIIVRETGISRQEYIDFQRFWLRGHLCPTCYHKFKEMVDKPIRAEDLQDSRLRSDPLAKIGE